MIYLIIRTCPRDKELTKRCVESAKVLGDVKVIYFAEHGDYGFDGAFIYRRFADNLGGLINVRTLLEDMKSLPKVNPEDQVIFSDADVIFEEKLPFINYGGVVWNDRIKYNGLSIDHVSGQCQVMSGDVWNKLIGWSEEQYRITVGISGTYEYADDIFISIFNQYFSDIKPIDLYGSWQHTK